MKSIFVSLVLITIIDTLLLLPCSADPLTFKLGPSVQYVKTSFDGIPQAPQFRKEPRKPRTYEEEKAEQAEFARINLQIVPGTKFDSRSNAANLGKERLVLEEVFPGCWDFISHLPKLKWAMVVFTKKPEDFKQAMFNALSTCPALEFLCIHGYTSKVDLSCFSDHPSLKEITFSDPDVSVKSMRDIAKIKALEKLTLSNPKFTQEGIDAISEIASLKHLSIGGEILKDAKIADYSSWERLKNLESLRIVTPLRDGEVDSLSKLKNVRFLCLGNVQNKELIYKIARIPSLLGVNFWNTTVSNKDLDALKSSNIKYLELSGDFEPGVFKRLGELTKLESLVITCPTVSKEELFALKGLTNLKYFNLHEIENCTLYGATLFSKQRPDLLMEVTVGGWHGHGGPDLHSYFESLHRDVMADITEAKPVSDERVEELFCLSDYIRDRFYYPLFQMRDKVALYFAKQGRLDKALKIQQESHEILMHRFEDEAYKGFYHIPAVDLSNGVHAYILGKQKKFAMAESAFRNATAQPGMFHAEGSKEIAQIYDCYAEILKDEGKLDLARVQEKNATYLRENPPMGNSTHSIDTRYWNIDGTAKTF